MKKLLSGCIGCYVVEFHITFANPDSFYGQITIPFDYTPECQASSYESILFDAP